MACSPLYSTCPCELIVSKGQQSGFRERVFKVYRLPYAVHGAGYDGGSNL